MNKYLWKIKKWFFKKTHPYSNLRKQDFVIQLGIILGSLLIFFMIYNNIEAFNSIVFWIFKLGSIIELILFIIIVTFLYKILKNLKYGLKGLQNGFKMIVLVLFVLCCYIIYLNPYLIVQPVTNFNYGTMNPFEIDDIFINSDNSENSGDIVNDDDSKNNNEDIVEDKDSTSNDDEIVKDEDVVIDEVIKNPTYNEMINFLNQDSTDSNQYIYYLYVCHNFAIDTIENAGEQNIRAGYVRLDCIQDGLEDHAIICFDTTDRGLYFDEPQFDYVFSESEMNDMISRGKYDVTITQYDGTIRYFNADLFGYDIEWWND